MYLLRLKQEEEEEFNQIDKTLTEESWGVFF